MSVHPWASDPQAQAAVRAAEDDAANWRRLEVGDVVQEGDEYLNSNGGWYAVLAPHVGRRVTVEKGNYRRRRVQPPDHRDLPQAVHDLRRRVEQLEACACAGLMQGLGDEPAVIPKSVSVSNSEAHENKGGTMPADAKAAPAANAGGEANQEPVAWGVRMPGHPEYGKHPVWSVRHSETLAKAAFGAEDGWVHFPLYAAPQPPRGWLTEEERARLRADGNWHAREADAAVKHGDTNLAKAHAAAVKTLDALLARSTPPKVKVPVVVTGFTHREHAEGWVKAIREAGVEVE